MRGSWQSGLVPSKYRIGATIIQEERDKERWAEYFENMLNRDKVTRTDIEKKEKVSDTLDAKEDLFCEEELLTVIHLFMSNSPLMMCSKYDLSIFPPFSNNPVPPF